MADTIPAANSSKDKLMRNSQNCEHPDPEDWIPDEEDEGIDEDSDTDCPEIRVSNKDKDRVLKLMGRNIGYHTLLN